jgi:hypothetical protein
MDKRYVELDPSERAVDVVAVAREWHQRGTRGGHAWVIAETIATAAALAQSLSRNRLA